MINRRTLTICLEGVNGAGKSTVSREIASRLSVSGRVVHTIDPTGASPLGTGLRNLILSTSEHLVDPDVEAMTFCASRMSGLKDILFKRATGHLIIERWSDAVLSFGRTRGATEQLLLALVSLMDQHLVPDKVILLDIAPDVAMNRINAHRDKNRFELKDLAFLEHLREQHLITAQSRSAEIVDADRSISEVVDTIMHICDGLEP